MNGPAQATYLPSAERTTAQTQDEQHNTQYRGIRVTFVTTVVGSASLTLTIQRKDRTSGTWIDLLAGAAVSTNTTNTYSVFPGAPVTTNVSANAYLSSAWRIKVAVNDANPATYSVGYELLP